MPFLSVSGISSNQIWRLNYFHIEFINPCFIACYNSFQKFPSSLVWSKSSWQMAIWMSSWSCARSHGTNFAATQHTSNFVVRMTWHETFKFFTLLLFPELSMMIGTHNFTNLCNLGVGWCWGPPRKHVIVCWLLTTFKLLELFITMCTDHHKFVSSFHKHQYMFSQFLSKI